MAEIKNKKTMNIFKYPKQEKQGKFSFNSKKKYNYCQQRWGLHYTVDKLFSTYINLAP